jgi:hypothetical protein
MDDDLYKRIIKKLIGQDSKPPIDIAQAEREADLQYKKLQNDKVRQYLDLQKLWSKFILCILLISTVAVFLMIFLLGFGLLEFEKYPYFPHTVVGSFFAEFIGLGVIVAKYLFPRSH